MSERLWIEIVTPPGCFGSQQWPFLAFVGAVIPVMTRAEVEQLPEGTWLGPLLDELGYVVRLCEVIVSLRAIKQDQAADFWQAVIDASQAQHVRFERSVCKLVQGPVL